MKSVYKLKRVFPFKSQWVVGIDFVGTEAMTGIEEILFNQFTEFRQFISIEYSSVYNGFIITVKGFNTEKRMRKMVASALSDVIPVDDADLMGMNIKDVSAKVITNALYRAYNRVIKGE